MTSVLKNRGAFYTISKTYKTLEDNNSAEFTLFFNNLHAILKSAINSGIKYAAKDSEVSKSVITKLQNRIDRLIEQSYTDTDCKRYVKRLRRERLQLLIFLKYDGVTYHNNTSERRLRLFALMRKVTYESRSMSGIKTTENLMTAYATCEARGTNPYTFMIDYLNGDTDSTHT